jgi:prepilin-type processing-associated H-X9-DG protein/prepilin-type N-terminal cleavage/methylation domain-containing protein
VNPVAYFNKRELVLIVSNRPCAFTLVELLVVISIIALLMSVLLPSLTNAQKQGEGIHCLANQRQLTMGWTTYAQDFEQLLCDPERFRSQLRSYVADVDGVFLCKGLEIEKGVASYGISNTMGGKSRDTVKPFASLHRISDSSSMLVLVDINPKAKPCFWPVVRNKDRWLWRAWSWPPSESLQGLTARHRNGCNMSFADGHVAYTRWKDSRTLDLIKGKIADPNEASFDNTDLNNMIKMITYKQ